MPAQIVRRYFDIQLFPESHDQIPNRGVTEREYPVIGGQLFACHIFCNPGRNVFGHEGNFGISS
jgi:hypothetical protein